MDINQLEHELYLLNRKLDREISDLRRSLANLHLMLDRVESDIRDLRDNKADV